MSSPVILEGGEGGTLGKNESLTFLLRLLYTTWGWERRLGCLVLVQQELVLSLPLGLCGYGMSVCMMCGAKQNCSSAFCLSGLLFPDPLHREGKLLLGLFWSGLVGVSGSQTSSAAVCFGYMRQN